MEQIDLTDDEQRVLSTLAALEEDRGGVREDEIVRETNLDRGTVTSALRSLVSTHDLVRELPPADPDIGPHYRVKDSAASA